MEAYRILLIDDEESQREPIKGFLKKKGYDVKSSGSWTEGMDILRSQPVDMIITDFKMPDKTGLDVLKEAKEINPLVPVVVMTAYGSVETAVDIMKAGAFDYILKPIELAELLIIIEKANERSSLISENEILKKQLAEKYSFSSIISSSGEMESVLNVAGRVATSKATVLIRGESGTGKELVARAIHFTSDRKNKPFIVVNCAAMPDTLFESELFGHEKGAFTGADKQRIGKFEQADGGTLFIDEVGDIPMPIQVKLLRAVQFGQIERIGGKVNLNLDVRIITATNRNLEEMMRRNEFREDLYYRFNVVQINIPPLRSRRVDIPALTEYFISKYSEQNNKKIKSITKEALDALMKYNFPGNVRELENIIQRAVVLTRTEFITLNDIPHIIRQPFTPENNENDFQDLELGDLNVKVEKMEKLLIEKALRNTGGNQVKAAELLNISERTLRYKIAKLQIK